MSDVSVVMQEYRTVAELSQVIDKALIAIKKAEWEDDNLATLAAVLDELIIMLGPNRLNTGVETDHAKIPMAVVVKLREERRGDLDYLIEDLEQIVKRLRENPE